MPKYKILFDTTRGNIEKHTTIEPEERLEEVLPDLLSELRDSEGCELKGAGLGETQVVFAGSVLQKNQSLPEQGVTPGDVLRVSIRPTIG